jgi:hypothetical protein
MANAAPSRVRGPCKVWVRLHCPTPFWRMLFGRRFESSMMLKTDRILAIGLDMFGRLVVREPIPV